MTNYLQFARIYWQRGEPMDDLRQFFKEDLINGYAKKFDTDIPKEQTIATTINEEVYSIYANDIMVSVHNYDENKANIYLFNNENPNVIFTHYKLQANNPSELSLISTTYRYEDDHSIINSTACLAISEGGDCLNKVVFFAEGYVDPSIMKTIVNILRSGNVHIMDYVDNEEMIIDDKNPYYAINKQENNLNRILKKVRK